MKKFLSKHSDKITGTLNCFDRVIIKGYLPICYPESFENFLKYKKILLKDLKQFLPEQASRIKEHAQRVAEKAGRPFLYITDRRRKEDEARAIAAKDGITQGLVCVYSVLEPCRSFRMVYGVGRPRLESATRKCLFYYFYFMDKEIGLMHIRLQSWAPFTVQVYLNGHEWLQKKLDRHGIGYQKQENAFLRIENPIRAQKFADQMFDKDWPRILESIARRVNPLFQNLLGDMTYYWVVDQAEFSTDVMFKDPTSLHSIYDKLLKHSIQCFSAEDVLTFLGRKMHGNFEGQVEGRYKLERQRFPGARVKHQMKRNAIKMYNKEGSCLRIETVINNPYEFKVRRTKAGETRWCSMTKGISNLYAYAQKSLAANGRYLDALADVEGSDDVLEQLDNICEKKKTNGKSVPAFNPLALRDIRIFKVILRGEHHIRGFKNRDVRTFLFEEKPTDKEAELKNSAKVSRLFKKLHLHGMIAKIPRSRRWKITQTGQVLMSISIRIREGSFENVPSSLS